MNTIVVAASAVAVFASTGNSQPVRQQVVCELQAASPGCVHLEGWLGERIDANITGRLTHVPMDELLGGFQHRPGKQNWIGEHIGKWLHAASLAYQYSGNATLRAMMDKAVGDLLATQGPDGYLGTYTDDKRWTSWDVWVHKYDLIGLLSYYQVTAQTAEPQMAQPAESAAALNGARKIGDLLVSTFGPGKRDIIRAGEHVGMAATSVLEPMVKLYAITGDERYLAFCRYIVARWEQVDGPMILSGLLEHGKVNKVANGKAYEMMSNLVGLCELYRVVGDEQYLKAARNAWEDINRNQTYITGGVSLNEHFQPDGHLPDEGSIAETCANVTWLQLCMELLTITGESKYAEPLETVIYNHLLGAQAADGNDWCYFTPLRGTKKFLANVNCCHSSGPRGVALIPTIAYCVGPKKVRVNLYESSQFKGDVPEVGQVELTQIARLFSSTPGDVEIKVGLAKPASMRLQLRVPAWAKTAEISLNGKSLDEQPRDGLLVLDRQWQDSDRVRLTLNPSATWIHGQGEHAGKLALRYGPFVLCSSAKWNNPDAPGDVVVVEQPVQRLVASSVQPELRFGVHAQLRTPAGFEDHVIAVGPYAKVGKEPFTVWLPTTKPD